MRVIDGLISQTSHLTGLFSSMYACVSRACPHLILVKAKSLFKVVR